MRPISEREKLRQRADKLLNSRIANANRKAERAKGFSANVAHKRWLTELYAEYQRSPAQFTMTFEEFKRQNRRR